MNSKTVTYDRLQNLFVREVSKIKNLKQFCIDNNLGNYHLIVKIKNGTAPNKYTNKIIQVLSILGYNIEKEHGFIVEKM